MASSKQKNTPPGGRDPARRKRDGDIDNRRYTNGKGASSGGGWETPSGRRRGTSSGSRREPYSGNGREASSGRDRRSAGRQAAMEQRHGRRGTENPDIPPVNPTPPPNMVVRRQFLGWVMMVLGLCVLFGHFDSSALLVGGLSCLCKGLFGYGYWFAAPSLFLAGLILLIDCDRPVGWQVFGTLCFPAILGTLFHLFLYDDQQSLIGDPLMLNTLWESGTRLSSGGAISGFLGFWSWHLLSAPVSVILFVGLFLGDFMAAMELPPGTVFAFFWEAFTGQPFHGRRSGLPDGLEDPEGSPEWGLVPEDPDRAREREALLRTDGRGRPDQFRDRASPSYRENQFSRWNDPDADRDRFRGWSRPDPAGNGREAGPRADFAPWERPSDREGFPEAPDGGGSRSDSRNTASRFSAKPDGSSPQEAPPHSRFWPMGGIFAAGNPLADFFRPKSRGQQTPDQVLAQWEAQQTEPGQPVPSQGTGDLSKGSPSRTGDAAGTQDTPSSRTRAADNSGSPPDGSSNRADSARSSRAEPRRSAQSGSGPAQPNANPTRPGENPAQTGETSAQAASPDSSGAGRARKSSGQEIAQEQAAVSREIGEKMEHSTDYHYPPIKLLRANRSRPQAEVATDRRNRDLLADTLTSFGVDAEPVPVDPVHGPTVTRYEFILGQGVKLSKVTNLSDDIALALGVTGVRIAPIPSKNSIVGIEVPNRQMTPVVIRDVVESREFMTHPSSTAFAVGKDISGDNIVGSISDLPHVLIAGTTGSGKSVCTNSLIISLLYKSSPEQVRFIMIDPKMVELAPYNGIPHLLIPVVTDPRKAAGALQWAVSEMMKRYRAFSENNVKKLSDFNRLALTRVEMRPFPSVVVVIDELADLMMAAAKEVEEAIIRIAQMGRAAGIHLVIATQRPSADIITGLMKANIPSRIAFAVASSMESRIILDTTGAEKLVGRGDMLYAPLGESRTRVQGCYISPEEIERVVAFVKQTSAPQYDDDVIAKIEETAREKEGKPAAEEPAEELDELLPAAVDVVMETGQPSVSMLQRRLKLGYSRAARLVDQMELLGYVGPFEGSRPRQLILTREQWHEIKMNPSRMRKRLNAAK